MKIVLDALAKERLQQSLDGRPGIFKPFYDVQECGCNGVLVLLLISEPYDTDVSLESEEFTFVLDNRQSHQFDEAMRLVADPNYPSFKLLSDSGVFSSNIRLRDTRES